MKKLCKTIALTLSMTMLLSTFTVLGDTGGKTILTLEEAKELALKDDTQYKSQQRYIDQKKEDYQDILDKYSGKEMLRGSSIVEKTEQYINNKLVIDNAFYAWQLEIFKKSDLKRKSDYDVTMAYYDAMKDKYSLEDALRAMDLAKKDLEVAKIKYQYSMITKNTLSQYENAYKTSQTGYNSAYSGLENSMAAFGKEIGTVIDVKTYDIDMTISIPDIPALDLEKIKKDYLEKSADLYSLKNSLKIAEYQQLLVEDQYDYYNEERGRLSESLEDGFSDLKYEASRDYEDVKYKYDEGVKELDISLKELYNGIITLADSVETQRKSVDNAKTTFAQDKIKYELGLISKIEFEKSESDLKDLENTLATNIVNLNSQYLTLTQYSYAQEKLK